MFIVLTTVLFHFLYYMIIPTVYFWLAASGEKNKVLEIITNKTFNFLVIQSILVSIDVMHCCWNKRQKKI